MPLHARSGGGQRGRLGLVEATAASRASSSAKASASNGWSGSTSAACSRYFEYTRGGEAVAQYTSGPSGQGSVNTEQTEMCTGHLDEQTEMFTGYSDGAVHMGGMGCSARRDRVVCVVCV